ncbi:MAG: hypothetical protein SFW35_06080 [Chitinophagales bacterium]|nr:hypothetical protein [Chitinophagales bacterium]
MIKDIDFRKVTNLAMAVTPDEKTGEEVTMWKVYLINLRDRAISNVMVSSEGYGEIDGKAVKTSALRQFIEKVDAEGYVELEILPKELTTLNNQFWVSFWVDGILYDKKYVFVTESIQEDFFTNIPVVAKRGVMII